MPIIKHKMGSTYYISKGKNKYPPLIALHGGPGSGYKNLTDLFELATDRKVYLYDQIGCGRSSKLRTGQYNIATFVEELKIIKEKLGIEKFHLFGTSWGTTVALEYYLTTQDANCLSITFQSPLFSCSDWKKDAIELISKLPKKTQKIIQYCHEIGATDSIVYKGAMNEYYKRHVCRNPEALRAILNKKDPYGADVYDKMWGPSEFEPTGTLKKYNRVNSLRKVMVPSLLLCGKYDEATPGTVRTYADLIPNSSFKIIPKSSHVILKENKGALIKALSAHLLRND